MRITRRQALIATALAGLTGVGTYGRFAVGSTFEDHVADQLGVDGEFARAALASLRDRFATDYDARAAGFLLATTSPSQHLMPQGMRERAIGALIYPLFGVAPHPGSAYYYAGLRPDTGFHPCRMLTHP